MIGILLVTGEFDELGSESIVGVNFGFCVAVLWFRELGSWLVLEF